MRRFSVRSLMIFIVGAAVGLAALRNANDYWATAMATVVVVAVATSIVGSLTLRGRARYEWAGFAVFSAVYLAVAVGTVLSDRFKEYFGPTVALEYVQSKVSGDQSEPMLPLRGPSLDSVERWRSWLPGAADIDGFRCVGHSIFALLSGLIGSVVGGIFYARRERNGSLHWQAKA
jgi:hypothetical protein